MRQRSKSDAIVLNYGEVTCPFCAAGKGSNSRSSSMFRRAQGDAKQNNPGRCCYTLPKCQLAKVLVERHEDAPFPLCLLQDLAVAAPRTMLAHPDDIVTLFTECDHRSTRHVLIGEKPSAHRSPGKERINLFGLHDRTRVLEAGVNILASQSRIVREDVVLGPALG